MAWTRGVEKGKLARARDGLTFLPMSVPKIRIRAQNDAPIEPSGSYVLYWMVAFRRMQWNYALDRAIEHARELGLPLLVFESLRAGYRWASDRHHRFILDGMVDNRLACDGAAVTYYPYVEPEHGAGAGLLEALAERAAVVVSDDYPAFFIPRMHEAVAERLRVRFELVDSNGLMPLAVPDKTFPTAYSFRGYLQKNLKPHLNERPKVYPLSRLELPKVSAPAEILKKWPAVTESLLDGGLLESIAIDHSVPAVEGVRGGSKEGARLLDEFLGAILPRYGEDRNEPEKRGTSQLSPYLHYGHISSHEVFWELAGREKGWKVEKVPDKGRGKRDGWWKMSAPAEGFLDELITWRELGYNMAFRDGERYERYESLPEWAQTTLDEHRGDARDFVYSLGQFERAETHDHLWNAAQNQLVREGRIHNYLRMLWGKKILEWTEKPEDAQAVMVELNNKYALDGRDPNSYSGIMWVLGRYDRAWGPERPIYGKIRYMSSDNTARKIKVKGYVQRYANAARI